jgi:hypothetical protein
MIAAPARRPCGTICQQKVGATACRISISTGCFAS